MATFTIGVKSIAKGSVNIIDQENSSCRSSKTVRVTVPAGQSRYVEIAYSGNGGLANSTSTITITTDFQILIDRIQSETASENTEFSSGYLKVSLTVSDPIFYTTGITRNHKFNQTC